MREKPWYAVAYMFGITAFLSFLIIGLARVTAERVRMNEELAIERAVLQALQLAEGKTTEEIHRTFVEKIEPLPGNDNYRLVENGSLAGYAVRVAGKGYWAPIGGFIGLKPDRQTVIGIAFYEQSETPGLGAEITSPAFRRQFQGLELSPGPQPIEIRPYGAELERHQVHAISGATQTCTRLEYLVNEDLNRWRQSAGGEETR
ncbi:MAG: FMN-binding protein [Phycisphaerae bacterium]|nr:FMN-binding protein [Phycisphaerae bacterium]